MCKDIWNVDESTMSRTQVQLWYNRFKEGREGINDDARPGHSNTSTTDENIEAAKKMIIVESLLETLLMMLPYRSVQKGHNWWRIIGVWLRHWNQSPKLLIGIVQTSQARKAHVKYGQMWKLCPPFFSIAMAWCIMNSCHKVVRSIKNTTLKLSNDCDKQFVRIVDHTSMLVHEFLAKNKTVIMPQPPFSPNLDPAYSIFFPKLKTPMKGKRFATIKEIKLKSKQEMLACFRSVSRIVDSYW